MSAAPTSSVPARYRLSVDQFERMIAASLFEPDSRLELLHGEIIAMSPINVDHAYVVDDLAAHFGGLRPKVRISTQGPIRLSAFSRPQPDLMLLKPHRHGYRLRLPEPDDVIMMVEVADTTFATDYNLKRPAYAAAGIRELWIIEIPRQRIHVCRRPTTDGDYRSEKVAGGDDRIAPLSFPQFSLTVSRLFG